MSCSRGGRDTGVVVVTREEEATELGLGTMIPVYGAGKMFFRIDCWCIFGCCCPNANYATRPNGIKLFTCFVLRNQFLGIYRRLKRVGFRRWPVGYLASSRELTPY